MAGAPNGRSVASLKPLGFILLALSLLFAMVFVVVEFDDGLSFDAIVLPVEVFKSLFNGDDEAPLILLMMLFRCSPLVLLALSFVFDGTKAKAFCVGSFALMFAYPFVLGILEWGGILAVGDGPVAIITSLVSLVVIAVSVISEKTPPTLAPVCFGILFAVSIAMVFFDISPYMFVSSWFSWIYVSYMVSTLAFWAAGCVVVSYMKGQGRSKAKIDFDSAPEPNAPARRENPSVSMDGAFEEIKSFKELLDMGAITEDEFAAKKKELLGL